MSSAQRNPYSDQPESASPPTSQPELEEREVKAEDPALSPATNSVLTQELREVIGSDRVQVPRDRPRPSQGERPSDSSFRAFWSVNRLMLTVGSFIVLTIGAILALLTNEWWILGLAAGAHAIGTTTVWLTAWRTTTATEHPSPVVAAAMTEDGVRGTDDVFSRMVDEFRADPEPGVGDALAPENNDRQTPAWTDPATAAVEEAAALTPTSGPSKSVRFGGPTDFLIWSVYVFLVVASLVIAAVQSGWMWVLPAVVLPFTGGLVLVQWLMDRRPEQMHVRNWRPFILAVVGTAVTVAVFCAVIAWLIHKH
ncbi:MAG TPA: hypothetical protein VG405_10395 [Solirubrobacteraceae bacterium]|nr:hypothetical protein [Solirubrobacteraceae bacterium]